MYALFLIVLYHTMRFTHHPCHSSFRNTESPAPSKSPTDSPLPTLSVQPSHAQTISFPPSRRPTVSPQPSESSAPSEELTATEPIVIRILTHTVVYTLDPQNELELSVIAAVAKFTNEFFKPLVITARSLMLTSLQELREQLGSVKRQEDILLYIHKRPIVLLNKLSFRV
jgi:hypothetical protein